jgi:hypothetical protein
MEYLEDLPQRLGIFLSTHLLRSSLLVDRLYYFQASASRGKD